MKPGLRGFFRRLRGLALSCLGAGLAFLSGGCSHYPVNAPQVMEAPQSGYRFQNSLSPENSEDLMLMLAFSGGGTRAAALAYGVLEQLARTEAGPPGHAHRMLDEVDLISSVSGGSFTAAYYALWGDRIFTDFEPQFLKRHVQNGLIFSCLAPWNAVRLASPLFNSSDLAAEYYDRHMFKGAKFGDLTPRSGRPFVLINATDIALGGRFEFSQDQFDLIRSDLSQFPISRAVAASAAFPPILTPIVLKNYSAELPVPEPAWIHSALADPASSSRLRNLALQERSYLVAGRRRFIHLLDGGITDNLGLRGSMDRTIVFAGSPDPVSSLSLKKARRVAVIIVDAHADRDYGWDSREKAPRLWNLLGAAGGVPISRYSFETIELFKETGARLARQIQATRGEGASGELAVYTVELHFSQLENEADRGFFNRVPTRMQLPPQTVDRLRQIAASELAGNAEFRRLVKDLGKSVIPP